MEHHSLDHDIGMLAHYTSMEQCQESQAGVKDEMKWGPRACLLTHSITHSFI